MTLSRRIEDYTIVTLITLLIWFYAESRTLDQYSLSPERPLRVQVKPLGEDMVVVSQSIERVSSLEFSGSRYAIGKLRAALAGGLTLDVELEPGTQSISLPRLVNKQFSQMNVNLTRIEPDTMDVTVARLVRRDAELVFRPDEVKLQDGDSDIDPPTAQIELPEDKLPEVAVDGRVVLQVRANRDLKTLPANVKQAVPGRVELPPALQGNPHVKVVPTETMLSFIIEKKEASHVLSAVPVFVSAQPAELRNFDIQLHEEDRLLKDVKVTGPADLVEQVESGAIALEARVRLTRDELLEAAKKGEATYQVKFVDLPPSLIVESPKTLVRATVVRLTQ